MLPASLRATIIVAPCPFPVLLPHLHDALPLRLPANAQIAGIQGEQQGQSNQAGVALLFPQLPGTVSRFRTGRHRNSQSQLSPAVPDLFFPPPPWPPWPQPRPRRPRPLRDVRPPQPPLRRGPGPPPLSPASCGASWFRHRPPTPQTAQQLRAELLKKLLLQFLLQLLLLALLPFQVSAVLLLETDWELTRT